MACGSSVCYPASPHGNPDNPSTSGQGNPVRCRGIVLRGLEWFSARFLSAFLAFQLILIYNS